MTQEINSGTDQLDLLTPDPEDCAAPDSSPPEPGPRRTQLTGPLPGESFEDIFDWDDAA